MNRATKCFYFAKKHRFLGKMIAKFMRLFFACDISIDVKIGDDCIFEHNALGVVISGMASLGNNCKIYQGVTLGAGSTGYPIVGNNVTIYPNSTVVGGVTIGDNCIIGANSFVNKDVPPNTIVGGVPARILKENVE